MFDFEDTFLTDFIMESNRIEGIHGMSPDDWDAHQFLLDSEVLTVDIVSEFVRRVANAPLRNDRSMRVFVGDHVAPPGGPHLVHKLKALLASINENLLHPYVAHVEYEILHPFMDGNGRSGRAIWLWHMRRHGYPTWRLGFLHAFYYQSLSHMRT